jgi:hypothetical protein
MNREQIKVGDYYFRKSGRGNSEWGCPNKRGGTDSVPCHRCMMEFKHGGDECIDAHKKIDNYVNRYLKLMEIEKL